MNKKLVLFDLDGTLLPQDQEKFIAAYFGALVGKLAQLGLPAGTPEEQKALAAAVWRGTLAMMQNDGLKTNEERFFETFGASVGVDILPLKPELDKFYENEFQAVGAVCGKEPLVRVAIDRLKEKGIRIAIATNPLFPLVANKHRVRWAGLDIGEFEFCTCYENSRFCKPSLEYYRGILDRLGVSAQDCLMVGNDVREDMVARELGMDVFLITDCLINPENRDINDFPHGSWRDFIEYIG
ncbi:MAG: HAD family hydrolase [Clostridia bacterium]|nr:HAD family hydrolase [Clostridia bacterium]